LLNKGASQPKKKEKKNKRIKSGRKEKLRRKWRRCLSTPWGVHSGKKTMEMGAEGGVKSKVGKSEMGRCFEKDKGLGTKQPPGGQMEAIDVCIGLYVELTGGEILKKKRGGGQKLPRKHFPQGHKKKRERNIRIRTTTKNF